MNHNATARKHSSPQTSVPITLLLLMACLFAFPFTAYANEANYDLYKQVLKSVNGGYAYSVFDIDSDGIAELFVRYGGEDMYSHKMAVYTIKDSRTVKVYEISSMADRFVLYCKGSALYYSSVNNAAGGEIGRITKSGTSVKLSAVYSGKDSSGYLDSLGVKSLKSEKIGNYFLLPGWKKDSHGWWWQNVKGGYAANEWRMICDTWYHFNKSGYMQTGWLSDKGKWYYLKSSGAMATGWQQVNGKWYYLGSSGAMATGWQKIDNKWYYLASSGAMQKNKWIGNYYVQGDGSMAVNKWIGKYHVDKNGKWDKTR